MMKNETMEHERELFEKIEFDEKSVVGKRFTDCTFKGCKLNGLSVRDSYFTDCIFEDCDLSLLKVKGSFFNRVQINRCKAIGINWFDTGNPFWVQFTGSNISYSSFFGKTIKKPKFAKCVAKDADFSDCNLTQADFSGTDLEGARFSNSDISQADFRDARGYYIDVQHNKVAKAKFSLPEALTLLAAFDVIIE